MLLRIILAILYLVAGFIYLKKTDVYYLIGYDITMCIIGTIVWLPLLIMSGYRSRWRL